jgi:hypothetical protein
LTSVLNVRYPWHIPIFFFSFFAKTLQVSFQFQKNCFWASLELQEIAGNAFFFYQTHISYIFFGPMKHKLFLNTKTWIGKKIDEIFNCNIHRPIFPGSWIFLFFNIFEWIIFRNFSEGMGRDFLFICFLLTKFNISDC